MAIYNQISYVLNKIIYGVNFMTILGSLLTFIIFSRKAFEKSSIGLYCKSLAIFDLFVVFNLVFGLAAIIIGSSLTNRYDFLCKLIFFITSGISAIPGWILVAFSFDQLIIVSRTERVQFCNKRWFQYSTIFGIFIIHCAIYSPVFVLSGIRVVANQNGSVNICQGYSIIMPIVYMVESSIIPLVIIIVSTFFIIRFLVKSRKKISTEPSEGSTQVVVKRRRFKFAFNSVILNILFIVLILPLLLSYIMPKNADYNVNDLINTICFTLFYLNFALHFWVHLICNSIFRREFLLLFCIIKN